MISLPALRFNYNYFRDYDPQVGRYTESDMIGLGGGINTYAYVHGDPVRFRDRRGLQEAELPGYERPDNAREAQGYFDEEWEYVCQSWSCPQSRNSCRIDDIRKPNDFLPSAASINSPPTGCTCVAMGWRRIEGPKPWDMNEAIGNLDRTREMVQKGPSILQRLLNALKH